MEQRQLYSVRLHLEPGEDGVYTGASPDVPGLVTEGRTPREITANVEEALAALTDAWAELGMERPPALREVLDNSFTAHKETEKRHA